MTIVVKVVYTSIHHHTTGGAAGFVVGHARVDMVFFVRI